MKLKTALLSAIMVSSILLSSCSVSFSASDLIHPPKTTGNEAEIQKLIDEHTNVEYMLKYPQSGEFRSAIVMEDLDNDKIDEAIACYRTQGNDPMTHLLIMYDDGKNWKISCDYSTQYSDIDCFQFADYDFDGNKELFTGFLTYTAGVNELAVFDFESKTKKAKHINLAEFYTSFTTGDYDNDGSSEAMLLTLKTADTSANATLLDYNNNKLSPLSACSLDDEVTKFDNILSGMIDDKHNGVIIDGLLTESYSTQVIYYNPEKKHLVNSFSTSSSSTERTHLVTSKDIDQDGFFEIPQLSTCVLPKNSKNSTPSPLITWTSFNASNYQFDYDNCCLINFDFKYSFFLPASFVGKTTALMSKDSRTMDIYYLEETKKKNLLLTIKIFDSSTFDEEADKYSVLHKDNKYNYCYKIADGELPLYFDEKTIKSNFLINDII